MSVGPVGCVWLGSRSVECECVRAKPINALAVNIYARQKTNIQDVELAKQMNAIAQQAAVSTRPRGSTTRSGEDEDDD
jgi:hypothetical protein